MSTTGAVESSAVHRGSRRPHVGREDEVNALVSAGVAPPSLVVIEGEAGIGKSEMVRELAGRLQPFRLRNMFVGHCQDLQEPLPLAPLLEVFSQHAEQIEPRQLSPVVGVLSTLVPELAQSLPEPPPRLHDHRAARHQVFRAATELLDHLGPAVLVLEDLHWAEPGTIDFLNFLAWHQPDNLSVVLTIRTHAKRLSIQEALARAPYGPPVCLTLTPFDRAEVGELAQHILRTDVSDEVAGALYEKSGGIPFVVEEVLRTLLERLPPQDIHSADILDDRVVPATLRDVVLQRIGSLDAVTQNVLELAAVLGPKVDAELICEASGRSPAEVAGALAQAHTAGLLQEQDGQDRFRHVLAHQIVYNAVAAPTRRWLHQQAARAIEKRPGAKPKALLAHHYRRGNVKAKFLRYAESAADLAVAHGDDATAARFLLQAMNEADPAVDVRTRLAVKLGRAAVDGLAHDEAAPLLQRLVTTEGLATPVRGEIRFALGRLLRQMGAARQGFKEIETALPDLEEQPALLARALAVLAAPETVTECHMHVHNVRCAHAEEAARDSGSREVELAVHITKSSLLVEQGRSDGWELIEQLCHDQSLLSSPREHARACLNWAQAALHVGHVRRAERFLAEGRAVATQSDYLRVSEVTELVTAAVDWAAGRCDGLDARVRHLAEQTSDFGAASLDARLLHASILSATASPSEATSYLRDLIADSERVGAIWPVLRAHTLLSRLLLSTGDTSGGIDAATSALDYARTKGNWVWAADTVACLVQGQLTVGRRGEARRLVQELSHHLGGVDAPLAQSSLLTAQALSAHEDPSDGNGVTRLRSATQILSEANLRYEEARTTEMLGDWRCAASSTDGQELLERALTIYAAMRASRDVARVCSLLRQHGLPVPYPWRGGRRSHGVTLSPREREVALLAATGKTNQEIAADLYLSRRTIESHISNTLRKLKCTSRKELAAHPALSHTRDD